MAVFVAGLDESAGKNQKAMFLFGGWIAPEDDWSRFFAQAWQEQVLDGPPRIPYLHMTEIRSPKWREQYGISRLQAEDRIDNAIHLLDVMGSLYPIGIRVDASFLRDRFSEIKVKPLRRKATPRRFEPEYICFLAYSWVVLNYLNIFHPEAEKVDFIVERNGATTRHIQDFHETLGQALEAQGNPPLASLVGEMIPGGKDRVPLQAADVLCWHTARAQNPESMALSDARRYIVFARRKGTYEEVNNEQLAQMAEALGV